MVRGVVGVVDDLHSVWQRALDAKGMSWRTLGDAMAFSHTYVIQLTEKTTIPEGPFRQACAILELDPDTLLRRPTEKESKLGER